MTQKNKINANKGHLIKSLYVRERLKVLAMSYDEQHDTLLADLLGKLQRFDWHGVSDAANDLRELEAKREGELLRLVRKNAK